MPQQTSPQPDKPGWTDKKVELIVGQLLRAGVILAAAVVLIGGAAYLVKYGTTEPQYKTFHGVPADLKSPTGIIAAAVGLRPRGLVALGLLLLIATPVARVVFTIFAFLMERDYMYVAIAGYVLAVLLFSLFFGDRL
ncbi:MAG TPA: DUF1634 domain-containing protein [Pirellulales bacterium]|jgi:uncharacterized membrane protein|nr:DUF1634 domain-containing protein [Pirellulales bacterium]